MGFKYKILLCVIFSLFILSLNAVFADEAPAMPLVENGTVSGDVSIESSNPWSTSGNLVYEVPSDVDEIRSVNVIVDSYSGSGAPTYALYSNITLNTKDGLVVLGFEDLYCDVNMANDPVVYRINNHTTKQYSDYQSSYNITDYVKNLSPGDKITISVLNSKKEGYSFDGRIKLIALVFAYDDGDDDEISYWLNVGQSWTQSTRSNLINTKDFNKKYAKAYFEDIALSSYIARCWINNKILYNPIKEVEGNYFIDDIWDITDSFIPSQDTNFTYSASTSGYGSFKSNIQLLKLVNKVNNINLTVTSEYEGTIYAGVINNLTLDMISDKNFNGIVKVYNNANDLIFKQNVKFDKDIPKKLHFTDSNIYPITENTIKGNNNKYINYTVVIEDNDFIVFNKTSTFVVLYDGYLGKDFEYPNANPNFREFTISGDVIVLSTEVYSAGSATNRTDTFNIVFNGIVSNALLYVPYNWDKTSKGDFNTWNTAFNGQSITPIDSYRDQGNMGQYATYGYGLVVYDVSDLVVAGENTFTINKTKGNAAVYPSNLIVLTNNSESTDYKTVYIYEEVDLLSKKYNANLDAGFNTTFVTAGSNATLYVFAASAQSGEGNLIVNGVNNTNIWRGTSTSFDTFTTDVDSGIIDVYFEATGDTILGLHQMVVVENQNIIINAPNLTKYKGSPDRFIVKVTDKKGNPLFNQSVEINLNGVSYTRFTDKNGIAGMNINFNPSVYIANVKVENAAVNSTITVLTTVNGSDITKIFKNGTQYYATFKDIKGNYLADGSEVTFNINGVMYHRKVSGNQGLARLNINLDPGKYILTAINPNSSEMSSNSITVLAQITENKDLVKYFRNDSQYWVKVLDTKGNAVGANETVVFNINGVMYQRFTDKNGYVKLNINLDPGKYTITAMYGDSMVSNKITVKPILTASDLTKKYGSPGQFKANLVDGQGKAYSGQNITFNINGRMYKKTTDAMGTASLNINLMPGRYVITSSYGASSIGNTVTVVE